MPMLEELKGQRIIVHLLSTLIEQKTPILITTLVEVEPSGIWIEGADLAAFMHDLLKTNALPRTPVFFVPFAQIGWIFSAAEYPSLSEKGLGL